MLKQSPYPFRHLAGQGLVEYGMIIALVALACIAGLTALGVTVSSFLSGVSIP